MGSDQHMGFGQPPALRLGRPGDLGEAERGQAGIAAERRQDAGLRRAGPRPPAMNSG